MVTSLIRMHLDSTKGNVFFKSHQSSQYIIPLFTIRCYIFAHPALSAIDFRARGLSLMYDK